MRRPLYNVASIIFCLLLVIIMAAPAMAEDQNSNSQVDPSHNGKGKIAAYLKVTLGIGKGESKSGGAHPNVGLSSLGDGYTYIHNESDIFCGHKASGEIITTVNDNANYNPDETTSFMEGNSVVQSKSGNENVYGDTSQWRSGVYQNCSGSISWTENSTHIIYRTTLGTHTTVVNEDYHATTTI